MKKAILLLFIVIFFNRGLTAEITSAELSDPEKPIKITSDRPQFNASVGVMSKYVNSFGCTLYKSPAETNELTVTLPNCEFNDVKFGDLYFDIWNATHLGSESYNTTLGDETDFTAGLRWTAKNWVKFDASISYYMEPDLGRTDDDIFVLNLKADVVKCPFVTPYVQVRYFGGVGKGSPDDGWFGWVGLTRDQELPWESCGEKLKLVADVSMGAVLSDGLCAKRSGLDFFQAKLALSIPIYKGEKVSASFEPWVRWIDPLTTGPDRFLQKQEWIGGGGFSFSF